MKRQDAPFCDYSEDELYDALTQTEDAIRERAEQIKQHQRAMRYDRIDLSLIIREIAQRRSARRMRGVA